MKGYVVHFNEEKGYGFIGSDDYEENIFVHISKVKNADELSRGQAVKFDIEKTKKGLAAINVIAGKKQYSPYLIFGFISLFTTLAIFTYTNQHLQTLIAYLLAINSTTFTLYGYDKFISRRDKLRVPELNLQTLSLLGGSPAALMAQKFFRHKTIKGSFQIVYWLIVTLQIGLLLYLK